MGLKMNVGSGILSAGTLLLGWTRPRVLEQGRGQSLDVVRRYPVQHVRVRHSARSQPKLSLKALLVGGERAGKLSLKERQAMSLVLMLRAESVRLIWAHDNKLEVAK